MARLCVTHIPMTGVRTYDEDVVSLVRRLAALGPRRPRGAPAAAPGADAADDGGDVRVGRRVAGEDVGVGEDDDGAVAGDVREDLRDVAAPPLDAHPALGGAREAAVHARGVLRHDGAVERLVGVAGVHAQRRRRVLELDAVPDGVINLGAELTVSLFRLRTVLTSNRGPRSTCSCRTLPSGTRNRSCR